MLSPTIPVHPRNAPVSPIIPVHTQKQGGWGYIIRMVMYLQYVGAPTFSPPADRLRRRPLHEREKPKSTGKSACATKGKKTQERTGSAGGGANFHSRLSLVVHTPLYAEVPRIQEHAYE